VVGEAGDDGHRELVELRLESIKASFQKIDPLAVF
jgi:hypothetical protein